MELSKNGGAFASVSPTVAEIGNGWYSVTPIAAHRDTIGPAVWRTTASGANSVEVYHRVITAVDFTHLDADISSRSSHAAPDLSNLDAAVSSRSSHGAPDLSNLDAAVSTRSSHSAADVDTELSGTHGAGSWASAGGTGTGARSVTVTIDDGTDPVEGAVVRLTEGVNSYTVTTNASGIASFGSMQDATYTVNVSKAGYSFSTTTLAVAADVTPTYSMTALSVTAPPTPGTATGVMTTLSHLGVVEEGVVISVRIEAGPGTAGYALDDKVWTDTSTAAGLVEFPGLVRGATYQVWRGKDGETQSFVVPASGDSFNITEVIGKDS